MADTLDTASQVFAEAMAAALLQSGLFAKLVATGVLSKRDAMGIVDSALRTLDRQADDGDPTGSAVIGHARSRLRALHDEVAAFNA